MVGTSLSHYTIEAEIGRGGMGIVYKAQDTKLNRTVAIKVLPVAALGNEDDKARFFREAQAAAQLQHANIATVYAIEDAPTGGGDSGPFIAMEYIEGETLTDRIKEGPLKLEDARAFAVQVATALEAAHEKNIVHRDIKSGNVMITQKGQAKVLDFGLAKTAQSTKLTQLGSTLGTVAYMSPEQARGDEVDLRSDLWSLGVLLYQMVSGRLPFASEYEQAAVYSILNEDPEPLTALRADVPMSLDWIVSKLLAKSENERYQNASDLLVDLTTADLTSPGYSRVSKASGPKSVANAALTKIPDSQAPKKTSVLWPVLVVAAFLLGAAVMYFTRAESTTLTTFKMKMGDIQHAAISPVGDRYAYVERDTLWIRELSSLTPVKVGNSAGAVLPFWSQDGRELGFFVGLTVWKVDDNGGNLQELSQVSEGYVNAGTFLSNGNIIVSNASGTGLGQLWEIPGGGGTPLLFSAPDSGFFSYRGVAAVPGTDDVVAIINDTQQDRHFIQPTRGQDRLLYSLGPNVPIGDYLSISKSGYLLFQNRGIWAAAFSLSSLEVTSVPERVFPNGSSDPTLSDDGTLLYWLEQPQALFQFAWVDETGTPIEFFGRPDESLMDPSVSPDETRVVITEIFDEDVWVQDTRGASVPLTSDARVIQRAGDWFSDGQHVLLNSFETGEGDVYVVNSNSSSQRWIIAGGPQTQWAARLSPDEEYVAYYRITQDTGRDVEYISITRERDGSFNGSEPIIFVQSDLNESTPDFHPSGDYLSYQSDISGQWEVYVRSFPHPDMNYWTVTSTGAKQAQWHPNGRHLYYVTLEDTLTRVSFDPSSAIPFGEPESLFHIPWSPGQEAHTWPYTFGPTSGRLGARVVTRPAGERELVVIQNWPSSLD